LKVLSPLNKKEGNKLLYFFCTIILRKASENSQEKCRKDMAESEELMELTRNFQPALSYILFSLSGL